MLLKKAIIISFVSIMYVSGLWAGDNASFVDLGFSADGKTYMFGQYGVLSPSLKPWAELYIVDVNTNNFVKDGRISFTENTRIKAGQDGSGILYRLLNNNSRLTSLNGIDFQNQGLPLYITRTLKLPENGEVIDFRDFLAKKTYKAELIPTINGIGQAKNSSFYINLTCTLENGQVRSYNKIGTPQKVRPGIVSYNFSKVLIDSRGESIIFVIEMKRIAEDGYDIRYMVEAQRL
jgi:predicted secreted protein